MENKKNNKNELEQRIRILHANQFANERNSKIYLKKNKNTNNNN